MTLETETRLRALVTPALLTLLAAFGATIWFNMQGVLNENTRRVQESLTQIIELRGMLSAERLGREANERQTTTVLENMRERLDDRMERIEARVTAIEQQRGPR